MTDLRERIKAILHEEGGILGPAVAADRIMAEIIEPMQAALASANARIKVLTLVYTLADELTTAVDLAAEDIGGHRAVGDILQELGPAVDAARAALEGKAP